MDVITINYDDETYGFFSTEQRYLLSLKAMKKLKYLMNLIGINYKNKLIINSLVKD